MDSVLVGAAAEGEGSDLDRGTSLLAGALDLLGDVDFMDLAPSQQAEVVDGLNRMRSSFEAVEAAAWAAFEAGGEWALDGHRSASVALVHRCRLSRPEVRRRLRLARQLEACPVVRAALRNGEIPTDAAQALVRVRRAGVELEFERDEGLLVDQARTLAYADLLVALRYWSDQVDPQRADGRAEAIHQRRQAFLSRTVDDLLRVDAWLDPIGGTVVLRALQEIEDELFRADWQEASDVHGEQTTPQHLTRTPRQRRADALVVMAQRALSAPPDARRPEPVLNVLMDEATFHRALQRRAGLPVGPVAPGTAVQCQLLDGPVLTPAEAIELALDGHVRRVVYDAPDRIAQVSERRRFYTGILRDLLEIRDRHCTHPGCDQPAWRCEADHLAPFDAVIGNTTADNGRLLCRYHHRLRQRLKHPPVAVRCSDGRLEHWRADGTPIPGAGGGGRTARTPG
jgi:hypothetical protein